MARIEYPHTFTKGVFKGKTFKSQKAYQTAIKEYRNTHGPTRRVKRSKGDSNGHVENPAVLVRQIVELYEICRQEGFGTERAIQFVAKAKFS